MTNVLPVPRMLRIRDVDDRHLLVSLLAVLDALPPGVAGLPWRVLYLREVVPADGDEAFVEDLDRRVEERPEGLAVSFAELRELAGRVRQVIDGIFVAANSTHRPSRDDSDEHIIELADVMVAVLDSSLWLVSGPDHLLDHVAGRFEDVSEVPEPAEVDLRVWEH